MLDDLTRDAYALLAVLYKEYLSKRKNGESVFDAKCFGSSAHIRETLMDMETVEDVTEWCWELGRNEYLKNNSASNTVIFTSLTDKAISDMEKRHGKRIKDIADLVSKFIP